jgi:hypothetical protein
MKSNIPSHTMQYRQYSVTHDAIQTVLVLRDTDIPHVGGKKEVSIRTGLTFSLPSLTHCGAL